MRKLTGCNLREATQAFEDLGGTVHHMRRTGEDAYRHPGLARPMKINIRRKSAPRCLTTAVSRLMRQKGDM